MSAGVTSAALPPGVTVHDFVAYLPEHKYIYRPTGTLWPIGSINAVLPPVPIVKNGSVVTNKKGDPVTLKPSTWLDKFRAVHQMTWLPGADQVIKDRLINAGGWIDKPGVAVFNRYLPPAVGPGNATWAKRWRNLVKTIYPDHAGHIIAFMAHRIQKPGEKINHALVLGGPPGIGKDSIVEPLRTGVGPWNFTEAAPTDLVEKWNGYMVGTVLRISEARDLGDINRFAFYERTKTIMAAPPDIVPINIKYVPHFMMPNVVAVIITTNYGLDGLFLPPDDRRHYVCGTEMTPADFPIGFWPAFWAWYAAGGIDDVVAYLKAVDLKACGFNAKAPPEKTEAFWRMVDHGTAREVPGFADALDKLSQPVLDEFKKPVPGKRVKPEAVTIGMIQEVADGELTMWLSDPKNSRAVPHRLESCGYLAVRNPDRKADGLWVIAGKRQRVYGRRDLAPGARLKAAEQLKAVVEAEADTAVAKFKTAKMKQEEQAKRWREEKEKRK